MVRRRFRKPLSATQIGGSNPPASAHCEQQSRMKQKTGPCGTVRSVRHFVTVETVGSSPTRGALTIRQLQEDSQIWLAGPVC